MRANFARHESKMFSRVDRHYPAKPQRAYQRVAKLVFNPLAFHTWVVWLECNRHAAGVIGPSGQVT